MQRKAGVNYPSLHPALPPAWSWGLEIAGFAVIKANSWFCLVRKTTRCCLEKPEKSWKRFSFPLPGVGKERLFHVKQGWAPPRLGQGRVGTYPGWEGTHWSRCGAAPASSQRIRVTPFPREFHLGSPTAPEELSWDALGQAGMHWGELGCPGLNWDVLG